MRYDDFDDEPPARFGPAGAHRGFPQDAPRYDDGYGADEPPPAWHSGDGYVLAVPAPLWGGWRGPRRPWRFRRRRPRMDLLGGLASRSRRVGVLRGRRSGASFPVFTASSGGRRWGLVTRPRRELETEVHEIVAVRPMDELGHGLRAAPDPIPPIPAPPARPGTTVDGWRLRLPHQGLHSILSRLAPGDLAALAGGALPADPAPAVVRSVARLTARSTRRGTLGDRRGGQRMELFEAPGYSLLVRPVGEMQGEIVAVRPSGPGPESELVSPDDPARRKTINRKTYRPRGARVQIDWAPRVPLASLKNRAVAPGIYILVDADTDVPVYLGHTGNFRAEWGDRFHILDVFKVPLDKYRMYLGTLTADAGLQVKDPVAKGAWKNIRFNKDSAAHQKWLRQDVEQVLLRLLLNTGVTTLVNTQSTGEVWATPDGIEIRHAGTVPPFLRRALRPGLPNAKHGQSGSGTNWITTVAGQTTFETPWG